MRTCGFLPGKVLEGIIHELFEFERQPADAQVDRSGQRGDALVEVADDVAVTALGDPLGRKAHAQLAGDDDHFAGRQAQFSDERFDFGAGLAGEAGTAVRQVAHPGAEVVDDAHAASDFIERAGEIEAFDDGFAAVVEPFLIERDVFQHVRFGGGLCGNDRFPLPVLRQFQRESVKDLI